MKKILVIVAALFLLMGAMPWESGKQVNMEGTYVWNQSPGRPGDLDVRFTGTGEGEWQVAFYFKFSGRNQVYTGTATGDLANGPLKGVVQNERKNRTFTFEGVCRDGRFSGKHSEKDRRGNLDATGTLKMTTK